MKSLVDVGFSHYKSLTKAWDHCRRSLKLAVMDSYQISSHEGKWNLSRYKSSGSEARLRMATHTILEQFRAISTHKMKEGFNDLFRHSTLRHAWILDQVTPESRRIKVPEKARLHEAAIRTVYTGNLVSSDWADRWSGWIDAYKDAFLHNVSLGAMNESSVADAVDEVDATKANTPASTLANAMARIFEYEGVSSIVAGEQAITDLNEDLIEEEIWKTRGDDAVCDDCDQNEGKTIEEADGDIPLHPNCHCYWLMVPKEYADLLRSGNEDDNDLAEKMLARGLVPNSLVIRSEDGNIGAKAIVDFKDWVENMDMGTIFTL